MSPAAARRWQRPALILDKRLRWGVYLGALAYVALALGSLEVNWVRLSEGMGRGWRIIEGFLAPNFAHRWNEIILGLEESLTMTVTATVAGIGLAVPFGIGAARDLAAPPVYCFCRAVIATSRTFQAVLIAIFCVTLFGFGPFAGFLMLTFATIGFLSKLLAEDIEDIDPSEAGAIGATGAGRWQVLNYGIQPQVMTRLIGLCLYRLDINFRESAVVGIVGAGGIGATLNTAIDRYEYDAAAAILFFIIVIVFATEYFSSRVRRWVQ